MKGADNERARIVEWLRAIDWNAAITEDGKPLKADHQEFAEAIADLIEEGIYLCPP